MKSASLPRSTFLGLAAWVYVALTACVAPPGSDAVTHAVAAAPMTTPQRWCDRLPRPGYAALPRVETSQEWFEVYRVEEGVFAIYEPFQFQEVISYLIVGERQALVFDTGMGIGRLHELVDELTNLPVRVLNSHSHFDHIGGNAGFDFVYALNTPFTLRRSRGSSHDAVRDEVAPDALCRGLPAGTRAADYSIRPYSIRETIDDGATIDLGGRQLQVLHVPGHTPDSIALLDAANGLLWTGDTFYPGPIWLFVDETDLAAYARSVARLAALAPRLKTLFAAHNEPVAHPRRLAELDAAIRSIRSGAASPMRREGQLLEYDFGAFSVMLRADLVEP